MNKGITILAAALLAAAAVTSKADTPDTIRLNGVPCLADTHAGKLYCPLPEGTPDTFRAVFTTSKGRVVSLDGTPVGTDSVTVSDRRAGTHQLRVFDRQKFTTWTLAFTTLPLVSLTTTRSLQADAYHPGRFRLIDPLARTEGLTDASFDCLIRHRGNSALVYDKKPMAVKLLDADGDDLDVNVMGIRSENSWILDAMAIDVARMRNRACFDLWNEMGHLPYAPTRNGTEGRFVEVLIDGSYEGLFCLSDKVERQLLGVIKYQTSTGQVRGVMYKCAGWGLSAYLGGYEGEPTDALTWNDWELKYPDDYPSPQAWQRLVETIDFTSVLTNTPENFAARWKEYFYEDNVIDFGLFLWAFNLRDNAFKNVYLSSRDVTLDPRLLFTPWDLDCSLGRNYDGSLWDAPADYSLLDNTHLYYQLFQSDPDGFLSRMKARWLELRDGALSPENVERRLRAYADLLQSSGAWAREREAWNGNPVVLPESLDSEIDYMADWYRRNLEAIDRFLPATGISAPVVSSRPSGIWTLDGRRVSSRSEDFRDLPAGIYVVDGKKRVKTAHSGL